MPRPIPLDVCWCWQEAQVPPGSLVAVIDVLRATSTIVTALAAGAASVRPVDSAAEALALRESTPGCLLAGERGALPIPGFDYGNSPATLLHAGVAGKQLVLATTNGSRALALAGQRTESVTALSLLNVEAVAASCAAARPESLYVLCSGTEGRFSADDAYVAGALLVRLDALMSGGYAWTETARAAAWLYRGAPEPAFAALAASGPGQSLVGKGFRADVEFCAQRDAFALTPWLRDGRLVAS